MVRTVLPLTVPVALEFPPAMEGPVREVLAGEYECGIHGEGLTILDIGANVGSFSLWASRRWPESLIHAYEPNPETFAMLKRNLEALTNIKAVQGAVYPTSEERIDLFSRYAGDGEAAVLECAASTFAATSLGQIKKVPVIHPSALPAADVVKIDVEGAEAAIIQHMDLSRISLLLIEYQNDRNRAAIKAHLASSFDNVFENEFSWRHILTGGYRSELRDDHFGHLFFVARGSSKLRHIPFARRSLAQRLCDRTRQSLQAIAKRAIGNGARKGR